jgi:mono/diheme cytochrome c family protein
MKIPKSILWILLVLIVVSLAYGTVLIRRGFSTRDQPSALETALARTARDWAIPATAKAAKSPFPPAAENVSAGMEHFADHCATCHANDGSGNTEMGQNLYPKPPDMRLAETQNLTDGEIFYIINNGVRMTGMPGWGESHGNEDTWKLVLFIRHLPQLSAEEKKDMERFNPKSADDEEEHGDHHDGHEKGQEHHHQH